MITAMATLVLMPPETIGPANPPPIRRACEQTHHPNATDSTFRHDALDPVRRHEAGLALSGRVDELWSWQGVARTVIAASRGELEGLPEVVT